MNHSSLGGVGGVGVVLGSDTVPEEHKDLLHFGLLDFSFLLKQCRFSLWWSYLMHTRETQLCLPTVLKDFVPF